MNTAYNKGEVLRREAFPIIITVFMTWSSRREKDNI